MRNSINFLQAMLATARLGQYRNRLAHTVLSGGSGGSFVGREICPLGTATHLVFQVNDFGCPLLRLYRAGHSPHSRDEFLIGTPTHNFGAYDLSGQRGRRFTGKQQASGVIRCLQALAEPDNLDPEVGLRVPELFVQFSAEDQRAPAPGRALAELCQDIRKGLVEPRGVFSPCSGVITDCQPDGKVPEFCWVTIEETTGGKGVQHKMLLPTKSQFLVAVGDSVDIGQVVANLRGGIPTAAMEVMAWQTAQVPLPGYGGMFLPLLFALPLLRAGKCPEMVVEDMRPLLGFQAVENPTAHVRAVTGFDGPANLLGVAASRVFSEFRKELGEHAVFASNRDILTALDDESGEFMTLSGMAAIQTWTADSVKDMRFRQPGIYVDFAGLRHNWLKDFGPVDARQPLQVADEMALLETALAVVHRDGAGAAAAVMVSATTQMATTAGMLDLLDKYGTDDAAERFLEEKRHALEGVGQR